MPSDSPSKPTVAIAGATGFVGQAIRTALADDYHVVALTRSQVRTDRRPGDDPVEWRHCDLFSLLQIEEALHDADYAIYLVHSMLPSARLTQGTFADLDLILADNFARAASRQGVQQILYVGGLLPDDTDDLSPHLASRLEVETTLGAGSAALTALRASLIVGPGGSSLRMLVNLVRRLPAMILPEWTRSMTQPIALDDVVRALRHALANPAAFDQTYDIGGPDVMSYKDMMQRTARLLGVRRLMLDVPVFSPKLSKLWVSVFSGASRALVDPLVESLRHDMVADDNAMQRWLEPDVLGFEEALQRAIDEQGRLKPNPRKALRKKDDAAIRAASRVRSVQRLPLPSGYDAHEVARAYLRWLPQFVGPLLRVDVADDDAARFHLRGIRRPLLELRYAPSRSSDERALFYITGGVLAEVEDQPTPPGRLEFREVLGGRFLLAAIHDFAPRLPWYVYNATQALAHLWVMHGFGRHLQALTDGTLLRVEEETTNQPQEA